jgi:hypothetical protein
VKKPAVIGVAVLAVIALGGALLLAHTKEEELAKLDPNTYCPKAGPTSEIAVLIDRTDGLTEMQAIDLEKRIFAWASEVPTHGTFNVYEVGKDGHSFDAFPPVCNPGDGSDQSIWDSNPKMWRERYEQKFVGPVRDMLKDMRLDTEAARSPIMEGVQKIAVKDFGPGGPTGSKRLILVTDLLQYTDGLNLYKGAPPFESFWRSGYAASLRAELHGVHVTIFLLNREKATSKQNDALGSFWIRWLQEQGADVDFSHISG